MPLSRRSRRVVTGAAIASSRSKKRAQLATSVDESTPVSEDDVIAQLKKFAELKDQGILTQEEFDTKKRQLLSR